MRNWMVGLLAVVAMSVATPSYAQSPSREKTMEKVAEALAEIAALNREWVMTHSTGDYLNMIDSAIGIINGLGAFLSDNPWLRVGGFSVGLPAGVSVDFVFPGAGD
jgi:hypothetical protein